jgi:hypothetical protein
LAQHHHYHRAAAAEPAFSLLRLSVAARLAGAVAVSAVLWALVWWAL